MSALKKPIIAKLIMLLMITAGIIIGSGTSLHKLRAEAVNIFKNGLRNDGIGITSDLNSNIIHAKNMLIVAGRYVDVNNFDLAVNVNKKIEMLENAKSPSEMYKQNNLLYSSVQQLSQALLNMSLSEIDQGYCRGIVIDMDENNRRMIRDPYNEKAQNVNEQLNTFPANILKHVTFVNNLELFK